MAYKSLANLLITIPAFTFCVYTVTQFTFFLSSHSPLHYPRLEGAISKRKTPLNSVVIDFGLLSLFVLQHSIQIKLPVKHLLSYIGLEVLERLLYNVSTCLILQVMMVYWEPVPSWYLWQFSTSDNKLLWLIFSLIHFASWVTFYTGCIILDMFELMGIKQIYYSFLGLPDPLNKKSNGLIRFYQHMRHPGFCELLVIAFVHPIMQLDRLLLAFYFAIYMVLAFQIDEVDCNYHKRQLHKKKIELQMASLD